MRSMSYFAAANRILEIGSDFHRRGWVFGTSGKFSAVVDRNPLRLAITESAADKRRLTLQNILEIHEQARVLQSRAAKPSAETLLHLAVLRRRTDAGSVLHTHSMWSTLASDFALSAGGIALEGYEMLKGLSRVSSHEHREWIPVLPNTQDM